ncbi:MAG: PQQ-binding-like beta-propeller repeat protein [Candidatus Methanofastidiosia archaeon]
MLPKKREPMTWLIYTFVIVMMSTCILQPDDWPMYQGNPQHTGFSLSKMPQPLKQSWYTQESRGLTSLVVAGETLVVAGSLHVCARDIHTGTVLWKTTSSHSFFSAVLNQKVYASGRSGISCFDKKTGDLLWKYDGISLGPSFVAFDNYIVISSNFNVFITYVQDHNGTITESERKMKRILCLNRKTGELIWEFYTDCTVHYFPGYSNGLIYINDECRYVYCVHAVTGDVIWKTLLASASSTSVSLDEKRIFVGTEQGIICLHQKTGEELWKFECGTVYKIVTVAYEKVFFSVGETVYCLDVKNGDLIWEIEIKSVVSSNIAAADKKIVFGTGDGTVYVLSRKGEIVETVTLDDSPVWVCVISNKKLFVGQENGGMYCFG